VAIYYISPTGAGDGSGSSAANASTLTNLNGMIAKAGVGGEVRLIADQGAYSLSADLQIYSGGATVHGVNSAGQAMQATISSPSASVFVLRNGADGLTFKDLMLKDTTGGYGALRVGGDIRNLTVDNVDAANVRTYFAVGPSPNSTASVDGLTMRNVEVAGYASAAIKIAGASANILLEHITLNGLNKDPSSFMMGLHIYDTAHDIIVRDVTASNNLYTGTAYWNGDGFATEVGVYNVTFQNVTARFNGDAGFDLKSTNTRLENAVAEGNGRNFRFWSSGVTAVDITGLAPHVQGGTSSQAQVWLGEGAHVTIDGGVFTDADPATIVFQLDPNALLTLIDPMVTKAAGATYQWLESGAQITVTTTDPGGGGGGGSSDPADPAPGASGLPVIAGSAAADKLVGKNASEEIRGEGGDDSLNGGKGDDLLVGGAGRDTLVGDVGNDTLLGGTEDDLLRAGKGNDSLIGGAGNDVLYGEAGADTLSGGSGADDFHLGRGSGVERVLDFSAAAGDHVVVDGGVAYKIVQSGADCVIDLGRGDQLVLVGVSGASLPSGWIVSA
jgi:Ca2+-binding RTX toxin-like protein